MYRHQVRIVEDFDVNPPIPYEYQYCNLASDCGPGWNNNEWPDTFNAGVYDCKEYSASFLDLDTDASICTFKYTLYPNYCVDSDGIPNGNCDAIALACSSENSGPPFSAKFL